MDTILHTPALTTRGAEAAALRLYGMAASASTLPSERDQNFLLQTASGERFVLKIANAAEDRALLEAQNEALAYVARRTQLCSRVIPASDGSAISEIVPNAGSRHYVRLLTWLPGRPLGMIDSQPPDLLEAVGRAIAELDAALEAFDHPAIHRDFQWDMANGISLVADLAPLIEDSGMRALVTRLATALDSRDGA